MKWFTVAVKRPKEGAKVFARGDVDSGIMSEWNFVAIYLKGKFYNRNQEYEIKNVKYWKEYPEWMELL